MEPIVPKQEDFEPAILGHKVDTLVALGHRDSIPASLDQKDFEPVDLGR